MLSVCRYDMLGRGIACTCNRLIVVVDGGDVTKLKPFRLLRVRLKKKRDHYRELDVTFSTWHLRKELVHSTAM